MSDPIRLYLDVPLAAQNQIELPPDAFHYLCHVMRCDVGAFVLIFNGRDGEWKAELTHKTKKFAVLNPIEQVRPQPQSGDLDYLFAPLKHARLDYLIQKAVEMGATRLRPVITQRTQVSHFNVQRCLGNMREAAEQCGILTLPELMPIARLSDVLAAWPFERILFWGDEGADLSNPIAQLQSLPLKPPSMALLIGPEGGFTEQERFMLMKCEASFALNLGPRILRADTAAVAAMALIQSVWGDWKVD